jgi:predicted short-subunit dehydrogenase-like oxidoreductase (DUF2520 family)
MAKITLIGSGNMAWHLGKAFVKAGHSIEAVYSRNPTHAKELAEHFENCVIADNTDFSKSNSDFFIVAVSDNALDELLAKIKIPENAIIAHTSGSTTMQILQNYKNYGVFYILQTLTKSKEIDLSLQNFGIEASNSFTNEKLIELAHSLSKQVHQINSDQRKVFHIAAVFASNFSNYLFSISETILKKEDLDFNLLKPLVSETVQKAFEIGPSKAQTGPAVRGDEKIIAQHLDYLRNEPELQRLYETISTSIQNNKTKKQ